MSAIVLVDTSVLLNVLDVPGFNQRRAQVLGDFSDWVDAEAHLFIPLASVFETGNHIAQLADGRLRRRSAERFVVEIRSALDDRAPWKPLRFPDATVLGGWLTDFPDAAMQGQSMGDLSIHKEWEAQCVQFRMSRVVVWSLDADLSSLDRPAP